MHPKHNHAYNFMATYERILNEYPNLPQNELDFYFIHLERVRPQYICSEPDIFPKLYARIPTFKWRKHLLAKSFKNWFWEAQWVTLYEFMMQYIWIKWEEVDSKMLSVIYVPKEFMWVEQTHIYHM